MRQDQLEQRFQVAVRSLEIADRPAIAAGGKQRREIQLRLARVEHREQVEDFVVDHSGAGVGTVNLVDHDDWA